MKKEKFIILLLVTFLTTNVMAMEGSVVVKTEPGYSVTLYIWPIEMGPLVNNVKGMADENGYFSKTFYTLTETEIKINVLTFDEDFNQVNNVNFEKPDITQSILITCMPSGKDSCTIKSIPIGTEPNKEIEEETEEVLVEEIIEETTETTVSNEEGEEVIITETDLEEPEKTMPVTGKSIFHKSDGSTNWFNLITGAVIIFLFFTLLLGISIQRRSKKVKTYKVPKASKSEDELEELERRITEKEEEIKSIKSARERRDKIIQAKLKLAQDEKELTSLKNEDSNRLKEAKEKLERKQKELEHLKGQR